MTSKESTRAEGPPIGTYTAEEFLRLYPEWWLPRLKLHEVERVTVRPREEGDMVAGPKVGVFVVRNSDEVSVGYEAPRIAE